ncbi:hypothetical protein Tsubulata_051003 [Turnera subulata]|uniref:Cytochrome P450 n=1 Tax=Turnera subulata TaxID=218843 RepID=A0A9Q0FAE1_9ROSI|nr:hypothetical protein Tsubulata_051003 [Turnera subulata]
MARKPLPPGPKRWPILGNIPDVGKLPHLSMTKFSQIYGPLVSLKLGTLDVVVASSPATATEILKTQDRTFATRLIPNASKVENVDFNRMALLFAPQCTDSWKALRALCRTELFSAKAVESQAILREKKVEEMVGYIRGKEGSVVNIGQVVFATVLNTLGRVIFSRDLTGMEGGRLKKVISKMVECAATPNMADFYPILAGLDPQGLHRNVSKHYKELCASWESLVNERRERLGHHHGASKTDFLDVFLANGFDNNQIDFLSMKEKPLLFVPTRKPY